MQHDTKARLAQADKLLREGNFVSAHFALKKILRRDPGNISALVLHAEFCLRSGKQTESEDIVNRLFELQPSTFNDALQMRLGHVCFENELYAMAAQLLEVAWKDNKLGNLSLYQLGTSLRRLGKPQKAEKVLLECLRARPDVPATYLQLGHVHKAAGNTVRAIHYYKKFIELSPTEKGTGYWCLADLKSYTFSDSEVTEMERELLAARGNLRQLSALHFSLGRAAEKKKDYAGAMDNYDQANSIQARLKPFHADQYHRIVSGLREVTAQNASTGNDQGPVAILIVGMPRSGTTLLEQILSAHSRVQATDELPFLEKIALRLEMNGGYVRRLSAMNKDEREFLRQQYLNGARAYLEGTSDFFIDKYPGNFLHIGLIKRIMPESIIIDARRDPRDIAVSAYRQMFNTRNEFAASFDGIYEYYKGYLEMIRHWQSVYPNQVKTLRYEQLVSSPTEQIGALLNFCGLDSEPGCFQFYKQKRAVMTPSAGQVSQPIYTSSVGQWKHYEEFAGDGMSRLGSLHEES